ncbi:hypothetical protein COCON_G00160780 [Conger conger]|uniref:Trichohyalin-like n=1 Tax=Conger conger TaxID=82655 RepID=A0A9Q1HVD4_CONCO|nr:hypothetical protein COCON_G00160780 [Conger conger]
MTALPDPTPSVSPRALELSQPGTGDTRPAHRAQRGQTGPEWGRGVGIGSTPHMPHPAPVLPPLTAPMGRFCTGPVSQPKPRSRLGWSQRSRVDGLLVCKPGDFDSVTIDSDLDRVRKHFRNALRSGAAVRSARVLHPEDLGTDQSDPDLLLEPRSKFSESVLPSAGIRPRYTFSCSDPEPTAEQPHYKLCGGLQALRRNVPGGGRHVRKPRPPRRETPSAAVRYDCSGDEETDEGEGEEEEEQVGLSGLFSRGLVQKNSAPWRKRPSRLKRPHLRTLTGGWMEAMSSDWLLLEEALHTLRQNCLREEERLKQKRDQLHDTELSLTTLLQQKKHAVQELECTRARAEQAEREGRSLEASLRDGRVQADSTRSQLRLLQAQRDAHMQELTDLEAELTALRRHKAVLQERTGAELEKRHTGRLSVLEREEMDRQLDSAKTELFAEQRRARHKLDSLQERLEETQQELDQRVEEVRILRESHCSLQEQREEQEQRRREEVQEEAQGHQAQVQELQDQLEVQGGRVGALERLLSQKEQQEVEAQEQLGTLQEEKRSLEEQLLSQREEHGGRLKEAQEERRSLEEQLLSQREEYGSRLKEAQEERRSLEEEHSSTLKEIQERRRTLEEEHCTRLREAQEQAERDKELQLEQLRSELSLAAKQEIQQVLAQAEEEKQEALREQALSLTLHADALQARVQLKEEELRKMKEALERQEVSMRKQLEQQRAESEKHAAAGEESRRLQELLEEQREGTQELVRLAVEQERRKWEAELRAQREALEDQARRAGERASEEAERERRNCLALQNKIVELQTRVQEQDGEVRLQQREQAAALAAQRRALREEQQSELQSLRRHLEQEAQREAQREARRLQQAQGEVQSLRATLAERGRGQEEGVARAEQLQRGWALELGAECRRLQELLEPGGATGGAVPLPHSPTVAQVVQTFRSTREQLCSLVSRLQQDLESQRHAAQQLSREKERELRTQRENLTVEREQALDSLKERLIQDHIEELSSLQRSQLRDSSGEAGGVAVSLRRQLQDKDGELREVQRSMGRWKEQTAARLARKFEEELTAELERCKAQLLKERRVPRARTDQQRKLQRLEAEMRQLTMEYGDPGALRSTSTPSLVSLDPPAGPGAPTWPPSSCCVTCRAAISRIVPGDDQPAFRAQSDEEPSPHQDGPQLNGIPGPPTHGAQVLPKTYLHLHLQYGALWKHCGQVISKRSRRPPPPLSQAGPLRVIKGLIHATGPGPSCQNSL